MQDSFTRSRTFTWEDPSTGAKAARQMDGLDYLKAMKDGELPASPLVYTLDFKLTDLEKGSVTFCFAPQEFHYNPIGSVHGGVLTSALDSAMGCCVHSVLAAGSLYTTLELKVNFLKAATLQSGPMQAISKIIHSGKSTVLVEASLVDESGKVSAFATSTFMIIHPG